MLLVMVDPWCEWPEGSSYHDQHVKMGFDDRQKWDKVYSEAVDNVLGKNCAIIRKTSCRAAKEDVKDNSLDFVFLDANHTYESVREDIELWTPKVRVGGLISGHDYGGKMDKKGVWGVSKAVHEAFGQEKVMSPGGLVWAVVKT